MNIVKKKKRKRSFRDINHATAADAIGDLYPGCEIYGLSKGQFSLVEIIGHCLNQTGPAHVIISTWTAAGADMSHAKGLLNSEKILSCRWLVDTSFISRQKALHSELGELFGPENIIETKNHAKFVTIRNEKWNITLRTSMNLNLNKRLENYEISDDEDLADYLEKMYESMRSSGEFSFMKNKFQAPSREKALWHHQGKPDERELVFHEVNQRGVSYE